MTYQFGAAAEDRTLVMGLRPGQAAVLTAGLVLAVGLVRVGSGSATSFGAAVVIVAAAAGLTLWPIAGHTLDEWAPIATAWLVGRLTGRRHWSSPTPLFGHDATGAAAQEPPPTLAGARIVSVPMSNDGGEPVGVVHDQRAGTYTAVLSVRGRSFQLADSPDRRRRLAAWGGVLAGLARASSPIDRLQWVERTVPEDADAMGRYLREARTVPRDHPTLASYLELVDQAGPAAPAHEALLAVTVNERRARRAVRQAGGGSDGASRVLLRELRSLQRLLHAADLTVDGVPTPRLLAGALRTAFDPGARAGLARRATAASDEGGTDTPNAWPLATETHWSSYRTADAWHATYWVAQWPRSPVGADFLAPLLLGTTVSRTVALTMEPVSPQRAHREVEQAVLKGQADEELRSRAGFAATARRRRVQETAARREQELADGHADYRLAGYVTVTAGSPDELEAACGEVEQAAQQSFLELRRLHGRQDVAFTWTLPLGRGLR